MTTESPFVDGRNRPGISRKDFTLAKPALWTRLQGVYSGIAVGFSEYIARIDLRPAFRLKDRIVRCIDTGATGGLHLAGGGILFSSPQKAAEVLLSMGATGATSHDGCGAVKMAATERRFTGDATKYGKSWTQEAAAHAGIPYAHISLDELNRPPGYHHALVLYYDGTGQFDYSRVPQLPPGFTISRGLVEPQIAIREAEIATQLAVETDHGFGNRFTQKTPFRVVILDDPRQSPIPQGELQRIVDKYKGRVVIDRFLVPIEYLSS